MSANKITERGQSSSLLSDSASNDSAHGRVMRLIGWIEANARWLLVAGVVFYIIVFAAAACYKYWASWMGFDLAVHLQVLWNTAHGRIAASSPSAGTSSYFGIDIILIELLLAPLYALVPSVYPLLTLQTVVLALGAVPIYLFACDRLRTPLAGLVFAAAYLLYAPVEWMNLYEFQIRAFATTFLLCALYALHRRRAGWFLLWIVLALGCRSDVGFVVAGMGVMVAIGDWRLGRRNSRQSAVSNPQFLVSSRQWLFFSVLPIVLGLGWLLLCVAVLVPLFRTDGSFLYIKVIYGWLGDTPGDMMRRLLTDPLYVLHYVFGPPKGLDRLRYLLEMFLPFAFLPLLAPKRLLPTVPIFALNLLSNTPQLHASTHYHYQSLIIPFMITAAVEGLRFVLDARRETRDDSSDLRPSSFVFRPKTLYSLVGLLLLALACNIGFRNPLMSLLTRHVAYERNQAARELLQLVPADAAVAATNSLGPPLAQREQLYVFPGDDIIYPVAYSQRADYLVVDTAELDADDRAYFEQLRASGDYRLIEQRNYTDQGKQQELSIWQKIR